MAGRRRDRNATLGKPLVAILSRVKGFDVAQAAPDRFDDTDSER